MNRLTATVEMNDGTIHENLQINLKDQIRYSDVRVRHKWPSMEEDPIRFGSFLAYAAMTRLGLYDATKGFDEFVDDALAVDMNTGDALDPTQ